MLNSKILGNVSNFKMCVSFDLEIVLTGTYSKEITIKVCKDEYKRRFTADLFVK